MSDTTRTPEEEATPEPAPGDQQPSAAEPASVPLATTPDADREQEADAGAAERRIPAGQLAAGGGSGAALALTGLYQVGGLWGLAAGGAIAAGSGVAYGVARYRRNSRHRPGFRALRSGVIRPSRPSANHATSGGSGRTGWGRLAGSGRGSASALRAPGGAGRTRAATSATRSGGLPSGGRTTAGRATGSGAAGSRTSNASGTSGQRGAGRSGLANAARGAAGRTASGLGRGNRASGGSTTASARTGRGRGASRGRTGGPLGGTRAAWRTATAAGRRAAHGARTAGRWADRKANRRFSGAWRDARATSGLKNRRRAAAAAWRKRGGRKAPALVFGALLGLLAALRSCLPPYRKTTSTTTPDTGDSSSKETSTTEKTPHDHTSAGPDAARTKSGRTRARATTTSTKTTEARSNPMSGFPLVTASADLNAAMARYAPTDAFQIARDLDQLGELPANVALSVRTYTQRIQAEYPIDKTVTEKLFELFTGLSNLIALAEEIGPHMRRVHADDLKREEAPRTNEQAWNV